MDRNRLRIALRVLVQVNDHTDPVRSDIEQLQRWVSPAERALPADELACSVISTELERRRQDNLVNEGASLAGKPTPQLQNTVRH